MDFKKIMSLFLLFLLPFFSLESAEGAVRIKEIAHFEGARDNQLVGYGLVVGLNGTGDKGKSVFTVRAIANMLNRLGMEVGAGELSVKNVAAVLVTATLPPFVKSGAKIDVTLSSLGDAKSLAGGILIQTPLQAPDGTTYAVAQGAVSIGGMSMDGDDAFATVARIPDGAIIEREVPSQLVEEGWMSLQLDRTDFTTCARVAEAINIEFGEVIATPFDGGTVKVKLPKIFENDLVKFAAKIERIEIIPDYQAKIIINERTGTIVGGNAVKVSEVSLTHQSINIDIRPMEDEDEAENKPQKRELLDLGIADEALFQEGDVASQEDVQKEITIGELAKYLNSLGVSPQDMIAILQSIRASNAIQAEIVII